MAGAGDDDLSVGGEVCGFAGGEAGAADQNLIQPGKKFCGFRQRTTPERAHEHGDIHGCLEAVTCDVANDNQQSAVIGGLDMEEIASYFCSRVVDRVDME